MMYLYIAIALLVGLLLIPVSARPLCALLLVYLAADMGFAVRSALEQGKSRLLCLLTLPVLFPLVHIVYGAGTLLGLVAPGGEG